MDTEQQTPHELFRLIKKDQDYEMQARAGADWKALYRFDLQEQVWRDYEITNGYLSRHLDSHFTQGSMAARPAADRRYTLHDNKPTIRHLNGETERRVLTDAGQLRATLEATFLLTLSGSAALDTMLARLAMAEEGAQPV